MNAQETRLVRASQLLLAVGAVTFVAALATGLAQRAWQAYLLNFLLWTGVAQCGVVFSAAYQVTCGQWSDRLRRMAESLVCFLPVSLLLFLVMMLFGAPSIFPWVAHPVEGKEHWLNVPFVTLRDLAVFLVVSGLSAAYVYYSRRLAPVLLIAFGLGYSLIGFDLVMSLDPHWYSTLFGWYFFVGAFYAMLAFLAIAAAVLHRMTAAESHDLGKLLFGFCLLTGGFFWAQWLVWWYGNLAEEITWVVRRYHEGPFVTLAWLMPYGGFLLPLVILLSKPLKRDPRRLMVVAIWIFLMMWLERYIWIVPSIWKGDGAPLAIELLISAGFLGGFSWGWLSYNRRLPVAALAAPPAARRH